jgi:probable addiction module antidote protein
MARLTKWDSVEFLEDEEAIELYLNETIEEGDKALILHALSQVSRARTINQIATETGMDREKVYQMFADGGSKTNKTTVIKAAKAAIGAHYALSQEAPCP